VTAYAISRRRIEIGIRLALGAPPTGVVALVLGRVLTLVTAGVVTGGILSLWASGFVGGLIMVCRRATRRRWSVPRLSCLRLASSLPGFLRAGPYESTRAQSCARVRYGRHRDQSAVSLRGWGSLRVKA